MYTDEYEIMTEHKQMVWVVTDQVAGIIAICLEDNTNAWKGWSWGIEITLS